MRYSIGLFNATLLAACASQQGSAVGTPLDRPVSVSYLCPPALNLRVRFNATSATIMVDNDGPFALSQITRSTDDAVYSDGVHVLQISRGIASYGTGRRLRECSRN